MIRNCTSTITHLEIHPSRINKEQIIEAQAIEKNDIFFEGCRLAIDPMITFGVKQVPERTGVDGGGLTWDTFKTNAQKLINREVTGNAARDLIEDLMNHATNEEWNLWYRRILIKDLRCGVSEKTINKVVEKNWPQYSIPVFGCQLAHDSLNHESKVSGKKLIEVKLDGVRVLTIVYPNGNVIQYSRNGKELVNFESIKQQFSKVAHLLESPQVFDGEVMSSSFQDLMKQVYRKSDVKTNDAVLYLFDMIPLENFQKGFWKVDQESRSKILHKWFTDNEKSLDLGNIKILQYETIDLDTEDGKKSFKKINQSAIDGGYEGIMIKDSHSSYECKRSHAWLKLKPFIDVSLEVINVEEGTGRNQGRLGALVCSGSDDGKFITVNVGSGFSDSDRDNFWVNRSNIIGQIVEIRADAITLNQDGTYSLRFPRFLRFRGFEAGEKI
jgi:DNA ligase-1